MKLPEKEFDEKYGHYDVPISLYQYLLTKASPFFWLHQNLHQSQAYVQRIYFKTVAPANKILQENNKKEK